MSTTPGKIRLRRALGTGFLGAALLFGSAPASADPGDQSPTPPGPSAGSSPPQLSHGGDVNPPTWKRLPRADGHGWVVCRPRARC
ncbi:hypothetical protein [Nocardia sp. NPDC051981]|uniref:hypothetical protein n=1 Tax=Nocardia sp. NPDC051981 TaxID=3155417 RepID=UPI00342E7EA3